MKLHRSKYFCMVVISVIIAIFSFSEKPVKSAAPSVSTSTVNNVEITVTIDGRLQKTRAISILNADIKILWQVISDFNRHEEFMPNVVESKIISGSGDQLVVYKQLKVALQKISFSMDVKVDNKNYTYSWSQHEGPFKVNSGSWILKAHGENTMVVYVAFVEPDFYLPVWIKKILVKKSVPKMFTAIENEALKLAPKKD